MQRVTSDALRSQPMRRKCRSLLRRSCLEAITIQKELLACALLKASFATCGPGFVWAPGVPEVELLFLSFCRGCTAG